MENELELQLFDQDGVTMARADDGSVYRLADVMRHNYPDAKFDDATGEEIPDIRRTFSRMLGGDEGGGAAYKTRTGKIVTDPTTGQSYREQGDYVYSEEDLQRAVDFRQPLENPTQMSIFDAVLAQTQNPRAAYDAAVGASYAPVLGTVIGGQDAYRGGRSFLGAMRDGDAAGMKASGLEALLGGADVLMTAAPFMKPMAKTTMRALRATGASPQGAVAPTMVAGTIAAMRDSQPEQLNVIDEYLKSLQARR